MKTKTIYLVTFLVTAGFWQWAYYKFSQHFNGASELAVELRVVERALHETRAQNALLSYQLRDYEEVIASQQNSGKLSAVRGLASISSDNGPSLEAASFEAKVEEAALLFDRGDLLKVVEKLEPLVIRGIPSESLPRAMFILGESYFRLGYQDKCIEVVKKMIEQFPENSQTGYLMLRQGMILKERHRADEARETFRIIGLVFKDQTLKRRAKNLLQQSETL